MGKGANQSNKSPVALQLWTIREAFADDPDRALALVKEAGFQAVELAPLPPEVTAEQLGPLLERHGLKVLSIHGDLPVAATIESWAELARVCRCSRFIWHGWPRDARFDSLAQLRELIVACNEAGKLTCERGLEFGMHNHWWEFEPLEGVLPIRLLHETLHPEIFWQLDLYWAQTAGADLAQVIQELGPRLSSVHWKDGPCIPGEPMTVLGQGKIDLPRVRKTLPPGIDWVIELDECATDRLEAARQSLAYLKSLTLRP